MAWVKFNANPAGRNVGDCTVRAVSKATSQDWEDAYSGIALQGFLMKDMPSANHVWGAYLKRKGFKRKLIPDEYPEDYNVNDFCADHPNGLFVIALHGHVITVIDGDFYDTWDSGNEIPLYYFEKQEEA